MIALPNARHLIPITVATELLLFLPVLLMLIANIFRIVHPKSVLGLVNQGIYNPVIVVLILVITEQINLANMVAKHIGAIVLLNVRLVILITAVTKRPLVFHLTQLAHLITRIVLLNVPLGVVTLGMRNPVILVSKLILVITGQINLVLMVAKHIGAIVLLNAKLVILTTVVTKRPLVFHLTQLAHLITLIVLLNVPLGVVTPVIPSLVTVV